MRRILPLILILPFGAAAQFTDNFADGNFSANPEWQGQTTKFTVNGSFQLQSNGPATADTAVLYTAFNPDFNDTITWEFYWRMNFAPSDNNQGRIYLCATSTSLAYGSNTGYYLRIGNSGNDTLRFYRANGTSSTLLETGVTNYSTNPAMTIKIVRYPNGLWQVYSDPAAGNNYTLEMTFTDNTYMAASKLGLWCKYTSSNSTRFYFDDFVVSGTAFIDTVPPSVILAQAPDSTHLELMFSETLDSTSALNVSNYSVNAGLGSPASAGFSNAERTAVELEFTNGFPIAQTLEIVVTDVEDTMTNALISDTAEFVYYYFAQPHFRSVVINELMADPSPTVGLPEVEFVEVQNTTDSFLLLSGWTISDLSSTVTIDGFHYLSPGSTAILCAEAYASSFESYGQVVSLTSLPTLNNSEDGLTLRLGTLTIDQVNYSDLWYGDDQKNDGGWSLEQINPFHPCSGAQNWTASQDTQGGTPGSVNSVFNAQPDTVAPSIRVVESLSDSALRIRFNETMDSLSLTSATYAISGGIATDSVIVESGFESVLLMLNAALDSSTVYFITINGATDCSGNAVDGASYDFGIGVAPQPFDVVINELYPNPDEMSAIPAHEFVELFNRSSKLIRLENVEISDLSSTVTLPTTVLQPGEYVIVCTSTASTLFAAAGRTISVAALPSLNNAGDDIALAVQNRLIDKVAYADNWYGDGEKKNGGWTLERINPDDVCNEELNWKASTAQEGGTPGNVNSVFNAQADTVKPRVIEVRLTSLNTIELTFSKPMDSLSVTNADVAMDKGMTVASHTLDRQHGRIMTLVLNASLDSSELYSLQVSGALDCQGILMRPYDGELGIGLSPAPFDLVMSEVYFLPLSTSAIPPVEYVEIYNRSSKLIRTEGLALSDRNSHSALRPDYVQPGQYAVVCDDGSASQFDEDIKVIPVSSMPSLNNDSDRLRLIKESTVIDQLSYDVSWFSDEDKQEGGYSLERKNIQELCGLAANWDGSVHPSGGTPGEVNSLIDSSSPSPTALASAYFDTPKSVVFIFNHRLDSAAMSTSSVAYNGQMLQYWSISDDGSEVGFGWADSFARGLEHTFTIKQARNCADSLVTDHATALYLHDSNDVVINEILFNPRGSGSDYLELYNTTQWPVNLRGWSLGYFDSDDSLRYLSLYEQSNLLSSGEYVAFCEDSADVALNYPGAENLVTTDLPTWSNTSGTVLVYDQFGDRMERFDYSEDMHFALIDNPDGVSLERVDPSKPAQSLDNWHSAAHTFNYGTPGYLNSQHDPILESKAGFSLSSTHISPDNDGYQDVIHIEYSNLPKGLTGSFKIYTDDGFLVRTLASNLLLGSQGSLTWDGTNDNGEKVRIGIHVAVVETFDLSGNTDVVRMPLVVAGRLN